jgi:general secretion pathway protein C
VKNKKSNPQFNQSVAKLALYGLLVLIAFSAADLAIIWSRSFFIPATAPPAKIAQHSRRSFPDRQQYSVITQRNLFSSQGFIPDPLRSEVQSEPKADVPVLSSLPINLIGTLVHTDPKKSVAAVEIKSKNMSGSYIVGAEIESMAKLEKVERGIIYFRNLNNGQLEYVEMKQGNAKVAFDGAKPAVSTLAPAGKEIQAIGNNTFRIKRSDLNKYLNDLNSLLLQARAIPNTDANGEINGYRLVDYQPNSIFDQLGLPRGTLLKRAGDEPITSIQAAMQAFQLFKSSPNIKLLVEIGGQEQTMNYEVQ